MKNELQQSVLDVAGQPGSAATVSVATMGTGVSTYLEYLPPIIGIIASLAGLILTCFLIWNQIKKGRILDFQLEELEKRKKEK